MMRGILVIGKEYAAYIAEVGLGAILHAGLAVSFNTGLKYLEWRWPTAADTPTTLGRLREGLAAGSGHINFWIGPLQGLRNHGHVIHVVIIAVVAEAFLAPRQMQNVQ
jgi:hypothetical protein